MDIRQDVRCLAPLPAEAILCELAARFRTLQSDDQVASALGKEHFVDATATPIYQALCNIDPLPPAYNESMLLFRDGQNRYGVLDLAFHSHSLKNARVQVLYDTSVLSRLFGTVKRAVLDRFTPLLSDLTENRAYERRVDVDLWLGPDGMVVGVRLMRDGVSVYLMDRSVSGWDNLP